MARKTEKEIDQQIKDIRWLQWQCLRRNLGYCDDVEKLIATAKRRAKGKLRPPSTPLNKLSKKEHQSIIKQWKKREAYLKIVETYYFVSALYRKFIDKYDKDKDKNRDKIKLCNTILEYCAKEAIFSCLQNMPRIKGKMQLPKELRDFEERWHIKFPIDFEVDTFTDRQLFTTYDDNPIITHSFNKRKKTLTVRFATACQKELLVARLEAHIVAFMDLQEIILGNKRRKPKISDNPPVEFLNPDFTKSELSVKIKLDRPKDEIRAILRDQINTVRKQFQERNVYERYFLVFDLREELAIKRAKTKEKERLEFPPRGEQSCGRYYRDSDYDYIAKIVYPKKTLEKAINRAKKDYVTALRIIGIPKNRIREYQREDIQPEGVLDLINVKHSRHDSYEDALIQKIEGDADKEVK